MSPSLSPDLPLHALEELADHQLGRYAEQALPHTRNPAGDVRVTAVSNDGAVAIGTERHHAAAANVADGAATVHTHAVAVGRLLVGEPDLRRAGAANGP